MSRSENNRQKRFLGLTLLLAATLTLAWIIEAVYDNMHLRSGPSAWFMVYTSAFRSQYTTYGPPQRAIGSGYPTRPQCEAALQNLLRSASYGPLPACERLLRSDAAKMHGP